MTLMDWDDPTKLEDGYDDDHEITPEEEDAILNSGVFAEDYADEVFGETIQLDSDRQPFGWDIADYIDWDAWDGESD